MPSRLPFLFLTALTACAPSVHAVDAPPHRVDLVQRASHVGAADGKPMEVDVPPWWPTARRWFGATAR